MIQEAASPHGTDLTSQEVDYILSAAKEDAGAELPATRGMGHRQHGVLGIRVYGLPHPSEGGPGEEG